MQDYFPFHQFDEASLVPKIVGFHFAVQDANTNPQEDGEAEAKA